MKFTIFTNINQKFLQPFNMVYYTVFQIEMIPTQIRVSLSTILKMNLCRIEKEDGMKYATIGSTIWGNLTGLSW